MGGDSIGHSRGRLLPWTGRVWPITPPERFRFLRAPLGVLGAAGSPLDVQKGAQQSLRLPISASPSRRARARAPRHHQPFPVQQLVIRDALAGHDLLVQSPTGSGKTLAFGIPLVERIEPGAASTVGPRPRPHPRARQPDRRRAALRSPTPAACSIAAVYGGVGFGPQIEAARRADILVATPGPARGPDRPRRRLARAGPHPRPRRGRPDARHGLQARGRPDRRPDARPSARRSSSRRRWRARPASSPPPTPATPAATPRRPTSATRPTSSTASSTSTPRAPSSTTWSRSCATTRAAARSSSSAPSAAPTGWSSGCAATRLEAVAMHGDKSQRQRERALARFEDGEVDALIATDVAARGIDVADVTHVINFDAPATATPTCTASAAPAAPAARGTGISFVLADQADEVRRMAGDLGLAREFDGADGSRGCRRQPTPRQRSHRAGAPEDDESRDDRGHRTAKMDLRQLRRVRRPDRRRAGAASRAWESSAEGDFCLVCRRAAGGRGGAGGGARTVGPTSAPKPRRAGLIEFEVRRAPDLTDGRSPRPAAPRRSSPRARRTGDARTESDRAGHARRRPQGAPMELGPDRHRAGAGRGADGEPRLAAQAPRLPARPAGPHPAAAAERPRRSPRSRWFAAGWGLAAVAWLIHVAALSMAPISLVQAVARRRRRHPRRDVAAASSGTRSSGGSGWPCCWAAPASPSSR